MTTREVPALRPVDFDAVRPGADVLLVRDMVFDAHIGAHGHEHGQAQRIRINIAAAVDPPRDPLADNPRKVVSYEAFVEAAADLLADGHIMLVETLAERLAGAALANHRVRAVRIRIEKLDVYAHCAAVGVEVERARR
ncbi:MAG: FolB domain-containing protein [Alphaproteobacteria bacterium]|jgi:dihydroneopterin aldolase|nr:FolB domain-containing protein [Alphaproteobacteria bacterium]